MASVLQVLTVALEKNLNASYSTIFMKEYENDEKNQIGHFHIHFIARKPNDFENKDEVNKYLEDYDKE